MCYKKPFEKNVPSSEFFCANGIKFSAIFILPLI